MKSLIIIVVLLVCVFLTVSGQDIPLESSDSDPTPTPNSFSLEELEFDLPTEKPSPRTQSPKKYVPVTDAKGTTTSLSGLKTVTLADLTDDLETWEAPQILQNLLRYYLTGYDEEDRPIWIVEIGKVDLRQFLNGSQEAIDSIDKFCAQTAYRIFKKSRNSSSASSMEIMYIADVDGLNLRQVGHLPTVAYAVRLLTMYRELIIDHLAGTYIINANAVLNIAVNLARPIFREAMEKVEIYGSNKERWLPALRSKFPLETLPPWYGGKSDYKPLEVYG